MIIKYSQLNPKLKIVDDLPPDISGESETLSAFLAPVNHPGIQDRMGVEKLIKEIPVDNGKIQVSKAEYGGWRYLFVDNLDRIVSVIQGVTFRGKNILSNIYTHPAGRKKGYATILLNQVKKDKPDLRVDSHFTEMGADFFKVRGKNASYEEEDIWLDYHDVYTQKQQEIVFAALSSNKGDRQKWDLIPAGQLIKAWDDFIKLGFVRNDKIINSFVNKVIENTAQLQILTELLGHADFDPYPEIQEGFELEDEEINKLKDIFENSTYPEFEDGSWMLSDYGLPKVLEIIPALYSAKTTEEKLVLVDRVLNVVHQRNDFALFYVEGGSKTLDKLAGKND
jgi:hypothetical protein